MQDKVAVIAGGTSGINLDIAKGFARAGAKVLVFGRDSAKAEAAAAEIEAETGKEALADSADVRDYEAVQGVLQRAAKELGPVDVLVAGAAGNFLAPAAAMSANAFKTVVDIDLLGTWNVFRAGFEVARHPGASFIAITAPQAIQPMTMQSHACAAKAGVNMVVKVLAMEWGQAGIRVNGISPGPIEGTEGVKRLARSENAREAWTASLALRRLGTGEDVAGATEFLASEEAGYITGTILDCDGGLKLGDAAGDFISLRP